MKEVTIYTDGACSGNPGPGGFAAILKWEDHCKEISQGFRLTTNNRMEMMAVIAALEKLKSTCRVTLYTDSNYVAQSLKQRWVYAWRSRGWMRTKSEPAKNVDLWEKLLPLYERHQVDVRWVRGHTGEPDNERADQLAVKAIKSPLLLVDNIFEQQQMNKSPFNEK